LQKNEKPGNELIAPQSSDYEQSSLASCMLGT
jgi:hypothetical protein